MKPPKRLTDPSFVYTPSTSTDIRKTFARVRREMKVEQIEHKVVPIGKQQGKLK
jgi:hypothetical protein